MWQPKRSSVKCDNDMGEKKRLNLAFSMDYPPHKEAWQALCSIPFGQRTDEVCRLLCQQREWEDLLTAIRSIVREEVQGLSFQSPPNTVLPEQAGNEAVDADVLGFLLSLQEEGEDTI